jgi:hypothetical protein
VDTVAQTVTFVRRDAAGVTAVKVAGSFTDPAWDLAKAVPLTLADGLWTGKVGLLPGSYQYKFVVSAEGSSDAWQTDALNPVTVDDGYGGQNSQVVIP